MRCIAAISMPSACLETWSLHPQEGATMDSKMYLNEVKKCLEADYPKASSVKAAKKYCHGTSVWGNTDWTAT